MRRLGHTAILLGFSAPVAFAAGAVGLLALASAPPPLPAAVAEAPMVEQPDLPEPRAIPQELPAPQVEVVAAAPPAMDSPIPEPAPPPPPPPVAEAPHIATAMIATPPASDREPPPVAGPEVPQIIIKPGNSLWSISRDLYGSGRHYLTLLKANRGKITDPRLIYPGQVLATPKETEN